MVVDPGTKLGLKFNVLPFFSTLLGMIRHHHEWFDGKGYPDSISGEQIPIGARILAAADAYDAMMTDRPYRRKIEKTAVMAEFERNKGRQFDPALVDALIRIISK